MCLSQEISKLSTLPVQRDTFPKIALFFDGVDYIIERLTHSILTSKILLIVLLGLYLLGLEMVRFARFIWSGH
jgi:uncharacterized membrane protein YidH (DUF202 family)